MTDEIEEPDEEAQLLARLAEIRAVKQQEAARIYNEQRAKEQYEQDWDRAIKDDAYYIQVQAELQKLVTLSDFKIELDRLHFKQSENRSNVNPILMNHRSTQRDALNYAWSVAMEEWPALSQKLMKIPFLAINMKPAEVEAIANWKPSPEYTIKMSHKYIVLTPAPRINTFAPRTIPGVEFNVEKRHFLVPLTEAWRIPDKLREYNDLQYDEESQKFIEAQITQRASLDQIAEREKPLEDIYLKDGIKLRDFQSITVEYVEAAGGSALIGHEMGLGKTPCAIAACERIAERGEGGKFLIIVPAPLKPNWYREIKKFTAYTPYELTGETPGRYDTGQVIAGPHRYYLANYDIIATEHVEKEHYEDQEVDGKMYKVRIPEKRQFLWIELLNMGNFDAVIIDEAHYIKNVGSKRSQAVRDLTIPRVLLLTGTPLLNRPTELWALLSMLDKEEAGPYESFVRHYTLDGRTPRNVEELREVLRPRMIRRIKKDVVSELPPINRIVREVELSKPARKQYDMVLDGLWTGVKGWSGDPDDTKAITSILAQLMRMKQVCAQDKIDYIADLAYELYDQTTNGHRKVLIFSQFVNEPAVVRDVAARLMPNSLWFSGQHSPSERQQLVDQFQTDDEIHYLAAGLKSAKEGLNITAAGNVIFADLDWTPANHHQAEARAYGRLSDLHGVNSYYVLCDNTIENDIWGLLEAKMNIFNAVIEGTEELRDASVVMELLKMLKERA